MQPHRLVYSWQWGNFNYPAFLRFIDELAGEYGGVVLICNEKLAKKGAAFARQVLTIPTQGVHWFHENSVEVKAMAQALALSFSHSAFVFSAGPLANILIPIMTRVNPANTYIDCGGACDQVLFGQRTRGFHAIPGSIKKPWIKAGGSVHQNQTCWETRWNLQVDIRLVSSDWPSSTKIMAYDEEHSRISLFNARSQGTMLAFLARALAICICMVAVVQVGTHAVVRKKAFAAHPVISKFANHSEDQKTV